ncbi:MAG: hypothetical protein GY878_12125 [Fuerstiella sp.]|nr:hypothetical protein [Fuerstiella sp.]
MGSQLCRNSTFGSRAIGRHWRYDFAFAACKPDDSPAEYSSWMQNAGLATTAPVPTLIHCFAMDGTRS